MKSTFTLIMLLLCYTLLSAQESKKEQSLLWEISSNNLEKKSYLYGTMHVSERIAFHLSDVFFEKLINTDKVALESNPETWLDEMQKSPQYSTFNNYYNNGDNIYKSFNKNPLETQTIRQAFSLNDYFVNGILYRTHEATADFQEETYLDMFLYQAGVRTHREIISLEDFEESRKLVEKATLSNFKFDPPIWYKKLVKDKNPMLLMQDAYRDRNLDLIDSLNTGMNSPEYLKHMLYTRNANMVSKMDSIFKSNTSLFIGIGAAHLPGKEGVIEMLKNKGYTVKPIFGEYTEQGKSQKEMLANKYDYFPYHIEKTPDNILSLLSPNKLYEFNLNGIDINVSPDLKNGAFINVVRLNNYDFLRKDDYKSNINRIDSLLYENIRGTITNKKQITIDGFDAFLVDNKTSRGDSQKHIIIVTPIENIIISMVGKDSFIEKHLKNSLDQIKLKKLNTNWKKITPTQGGFSVEVPAYYTINANNKYTASIENPIITAYDASDKSYYFVLQQNLSDTEYLEDSEFELSRIHYEFYKNLKIDSTQTEFTKKPLSFYSQAKLNNNKTLRLKSVVNGSHYYLLGSVSNIAKTKQFFNSFTYTNFTHFKTPKVYKDSTLNFTTKVPIIPAASEVDFESFYDYGSNKNKYNEVVKQRTFSDESKQKINVLYRRFDGYAFQENIDSIWQNILTNNLEDYELTSKDKKTYKNDNGYFVMNTNFINPESEQMIKAKYLIKDDAFYSLKTLVNKNYNNNNTFIEDFYETFTPKDTLIGRSVFEKKAPYFFKDLNSSNDSIRSSAMSAVYKIKFTNDDFSNLKQTIDKFDFKTEELTTKENLIIEIGRLKHPNLISYLENLYKKNTGNSDIQLSILKALSIQNTNDATQKIIELMDFDLPLPNSSNKISSLFSYFNDYAKSNQALIPYIFQFQAVPEYQSSIIDLTASLIDSSYIAPRKVKKQKNNILTLAKLELKRSQSNWLDAKKYKAEYGYSNDFEIDFYLLERYCILLSGFKEDKNVKAFFNKLDAIDEPELQLFRVTQKLKSEEEVDPTVLQNIANKDELVFKLYSVLKKYNSLALLPKNANNKAIAKSVILNDTYDFNPEKDSLTFLLEKNVTYKESNYKILFFKLTQTDEYRGVPISMIESVPFKLDKDLTLNIEPENFINTNSTEFLDDESLEEFITTEIDRTLFHDKKRVTFDYSYDSILGY